jgi:hypothetical protein
VKIAALPKQEQIAIATQTDDRERARLVRNAKDHATVEELSAAATQPKRERASCDGMRFARAAIELLRKIRKNDLERKQALDFTRRWIDEQ